LGTIADRIQAFKDDLNMFSDWTERYSYLIDLGKEMDRLAPEYQKDEYLVEGCQSRVWLHTEFDGRNMHIKADSDALIVRGLAAMVVRILSALPAAEIAALPEDFLNRLDLDSHLSLSRANGLSAMLNRIRALARGYTEIAKNT
jgi:cysteine desulfuration protein SufE